ncbi:hypothetical protein [Indiicoccus explosivorum]|uniref:hypothetical protein n=1 Tax=Indiicoccus explosivorum TaxID=1917864 RepID=UPI000B442E7F|nr:hypothetical protein [Indiicoccus explosivorum]
MYNDLPAGVKSSITRSISSVFEKYMAEIGWQEDRFQLEEFMALWQHYIRNNASWYAKVPDAVKADPAFHQEIADRMNQSFDKVLSEPPSEEQIERIERLQNELGTDITYSCKAEAAYVENRLAAEQKKQGSPN